MPTPTHILARTKARLAKRNGRRSMGDIMVFLVGSSPYRFAAVSVETIELSALPEYAREIVSRTEGNGTVYGITCRPIIGVRAPTKPGQLLLTTFPSAIG
ncbi:MAG: hypothetical protein ABIH80_01815 [Methanobacteriota archaeon]